MSATGPNPKALELPDLLYPVVFSTPRKQKAEERKVRN